MDIQGKGIAILATHGFEQAELIEPMNALRRAGAMVHVVSPESGHIQGLRHFDKSDKMEVDRTLAQAKAESYDALVIPGGLSSPDKLRTNEKALAFVRAFDVAGKPIAAISYGPWVLVNAGVARGHTLTCAAAIRADLMNAGAEVEEREVVVDGNLITSRTARDLPAFCRALIHRLMRQELPRVRILRSAEMV